MKKGFITLLALLMFLMSGCSSSQNKIGKYDEQMSGSYESKVDENKNDTTIVNGGDDIYTDSSYQLMYMSFEDCIAAATNVLSATFTGDIETHGIYQDLLFSSNKQIKGAGIVDDFRVRVSDQNVSIEKTDINYSTSSSNYESGKTYLLVLEKHVSVYNPYDLYLPLGNIMIVENESATMYGGEALSSHSSIGVDNPNTTEIMSYVANLKESIEDVANVTGIEYIRSSDITDIVKGTSIVLEVTPIEYIGGSENNDTERFICTVNKVLKGSLTGEIIKIIFGEGTVELEKSYYVLVEQLSDSSYYILSSKNSVYSSDSAIATQIEDCILH